MNENKLKRLVAAATSTAVILLVILICVLIFQLASLNSERAKEKEYREAIAYYEELIEQKADIIEVKKQRWYIEKIARELGYHYEAE